jgi:hypothetical protein
LFGSESSERSDTSSALTCTRTRCDAEADRQRAALARYIQHRGPLVCCQDVEADAAALRVHVRVEQSRRKFALQTFVSSKSARGEEGGGGGRLRRFVRILRAELKGNLVLEALVHRARAAVDGAQPLKQVVVLGKCRNTLVTAHLRSHKKLLCAMRPGQQPRPQQARKQGEQ